MAFITKEDFYSHIYEEAIETISRGDDTILDNAIQAATNRVMRGLGRYDTDLIFAGVTAAEKAPYAELITYIKDIAKWHFIASSNVQVDYAVAKDRYDQAIKEVERLRAGATILGWPLAVVDTEDVFRSESNPKFNHYY